jgi:hypothetical protein
LDESLQQANTILAATEAIKRLLDERVLLADEIAKAEKQRPSTSDKAQLARRAANVGACNVKLAKNECKIQEQLAREHTAREQLAKLSQIKDSRLETIENEAYRARRPPVGQGIRLTPTDLRVAQDSVPQGVFFVAMISVTMIAIVSISNLSLPSWLSILIAVFAFAVPTALGVVQVHYARLAEKRARKAEDERKMTKQTDT